MKKWFASLKDDAVLLIIWVLACCSCFFIKPSLTYFTYIDYTTLILLFCLMAIVNSLRHVGLFEKIAFLLLEKIKTIRQLYFLLVGLCFFFSMLITNDVALISFVPLTIIVLKTTKMEEHIIFVVVMQTIAANLGSMCTPFGNPQNLYLYSYFQLQLGDFLLYILPYGLLAFFILFVHLFRKSNASIKKIKMESPIIKDQCLLWMNLMLFLICILNVLHLIEIYFVFLVVLIILLCFDKKAILEVDYHLLLTFIGFFIFIGNIKQIDAISQMLSHILVGKEVITAIFCSQIFSNVPTAILLSAFSDQAKLLLIGTNIGGLGTLIASMASLISYKFVLKAYPESRKHYLVLFTKYNILYLLIFYGFVLMIGR